MKPPTGKSSNKAGARGANAGSPEELTEGSDGDRLTAGMLVKALDSLKVDICSKIDLAVGGVQADIAAVREELTFSVTSLQKTVEEQDSRLKDLETSATTTSDSMSALEATVTTLQNQVKELQFKCEDLDNRSRRNNIRLVGIPEDLEGVSATEFVSSVLRDVLKLSEELSVATHWSSGGSEKPFIQGMSQWLHIYPVPLLWSALSMCGLLSSSLRNQATIFIEQLVKINVKLLDLRYVVGVVRLPV